MKKRNTALCIVFSLITCGIYCIYWTFQLVKAVPQLTGVRPTVENPLLEGFLCLTPYSWYWLWKAGDSLDKCAKKGISRGNNGVVFIILAIFCLGIVDYAVIQNEINKVAVE